MLDKISPQKPQKFGKFLLGSAILGTVCVAILLISISAQKQSHLELQYNLDLQEFQLFLTKYNKQYPTEEEFANRLKIFRDNLSYIRLFNSQGKTWILGANKFADLTVKEFRNRFHKIFNLNEISETSPQENTQKIEIPAQVDWTAQGAVTPVGDEGECGGPYAFSAVGAIESAWFIAGHQLTPLSVQEIIDCSSSFGNDGCTQGRMTNTYNFVIKNGITSAQIYPFTGKTEKCISAKEKQIVATVSAYRNVTSLSAVALETAIAQVPVSVAVEADSWQLYVGGVITSDCGTNIDHAVLAVGYNLINSPPYYKLKNDWGADWGEAGYVRIEVVNGKGMCGIQMLSSYPII